MATPHIYSIFVGISCSTSDSFVARFKSCGLFFSGDEKGSQLVRALRGVGSLAEGRFDLCLRYLQIGSRSLV